jgi:hypothetical protein
VKVEVEKKEEVSRALGLWTRGGMTREETEVCEATGNAEDRVKTDGVEERDTDTGKKTWRTPKLRVLVRAKRDEAVLWQCKNSTGPQTGPYYRNSTCYLSTSCLSRCEAVAGS